MAIETVAVLGAGAVGSYFIWGLSELLGENLWVVAKDARREKLIKEGISINEQNYVLHVRTPQEARGVDLLLIATKYGGLMDALNDIETIVTENTVVMSLLNGVDSEELIAERIGEEKLVYSMIKIASQRVGQSICFDGDSTIGVVFGEKDSEEPSERMRAIADLFSKTPLHYRMSPSILQDIWYKFAFNVSWNLPQAILGCPTGAFVVSEHIQALRTGLRKEVTAVAAALGIDISAPSDIEQMRCPSAPGSRYSTLQDLDAGRHTEVDMFAGAVVRLGEKYDIPTPYNTFALHAIHALEEKNDGLFDFS